MNEDEQLIAYEKEDVASSKGFVAWIKSHKKQLIIASVSVPTIIAIALGIKNKDTLKELWEGLKDQMETANLYSSNWFAKSTDEELKLEREKVRLAYCSSGDDLNEAGRLQNLLLRFDNEMSKRAWGDEIPHGPSIHREHGWYLPNDD